ncbi:MAG: NPCBM/NEW2 domain-containing protein, partial [Planctomycetaceae bacterium]|nr:NPCBM/NEW2 domain-containing protein [Planctomycetaceae bacterium]
LLLLSLNADAPQVEVSTLEGPPQVGQLSDLDARRLTLIQDGKSQSLPTDGILQLRFPAAAEAAPAAGAVTLTLVDGSRLRGGKLSASASRVQMEHPQLGALAVPRDQVRSVRMAADDATVTAAWDQLAARETKDDLIVIRKGDVLDHVDGVVGTVDDASVKFLLDGDDVTVKRERVFGIVYASRGVKPAARGIRVELAGDDSLFVPQIAFKDNRWELPWPGKELFRAPATAVRAVDFSAGKVVFLSTLQPREVEETPYFLIMFPYQKARSLEGRPLRVGPRSFTRGLAIHSKTRLQYRLGGEFRRFTAEVGIDPEIENGDALLKIVGDGKVLLEENITALEPPRSISLPVDGVVELDIIVDYGRDRLDIGDRVHLGDAKVTK